MRRIEDVVNDAWKDCIALIAEDAAMFSEQARIEAERGDREAALYASSAAEFALVAIDALRAPRLAVAHALDKR